MSPDDEDAFQKHGPTIRETLKRKAEEKKIPKNSRKKGKPLKSSNAGDPAIPEVSKKQEAIDLLRDRFTDKYRDGMGGSGFGSRGASGQPLGINCGMRDIVNGADTTDCIIKEGQGGDIGRELSCNVSYDRIQCHSGPDGGDDVSILEDPSQRPVVVSQLAPQEKLRRIHVWDDDFDNVKDLQQHWADGKGCLVCSHSIPVHT
ncbi:hypothetical protein KC19_VG133900 [Ceratodon purpureus]|uniref:Uncharacterized protein n=1 Tax=Ceratodon purpureus TaxID=3225 RepID=A0A8T0HQ91_CERPU|nr:hypothetical protein KC19_VG133900 [Ceratodon purpureus]